MTAALSTLVVLGFLWFIAAHALAVLEDSGSKILAALNGRSPLAMTPAVQPISWKVRAPARTMRPMRVRPTLRAAA